MSYIIGLVQRSDRAPSFEVITLSRVQWTRVAIITSLIRINGASKHSKDDKLTSDLLGRQVTVCSYRVLLETIEFILFGHFARFPNNPSMLSYLRLPNWELDDQV